MWEQMFGARIAGEKENAFRFMRLRTTTSFTPAQDANGRLVIHRSLREKIRIEIPDRET
jgi:hypothetical protein